MVGLPRRDGSGRAVVFGGGTDGTGVINLEGVGNGAQRIAGGLSCRGEWGLV
jgi:hypothetical protein